MGIKLRTQMYPSVLANVLGAQKEHMFWLRNKKIKFSLRTLNLSPVNFKNLDYILYMNYCENMDI